eukprot:3580775-Amphidinium_carterae.1
MVAARSRSSSTSRQQQHQENFSKLLLIKIEPINKSSVGSNGLSFGLLSSSTMTSFQDDFLKFIIGKLFDFIWKLNFINRLCIISIVLSVYVYIKLPAAQHVHHLQQFASDCSSASPGLVVPSICGQPTIIMSTEAFPAISGPEVAEVTVIDHNNHPQEQPPDTAMVAITPRNSDHLVASGTPAPLPANGQQPSTHHWIPAGDFTSPIDPSSDGWASMPYTSTASKMSDEMLLSKAASLAYSSHIMASREYDHQTTSVKEWITSFRNLRVKAASASTSADTPTEMQQVLSSSSIKELQRQGSINTSVSSK